MDPLTNPYTPGAGKTPSYISGRQTEISEFEVLVARTKRKIIDRGFIYTGLRGVGKTVLLHYLLSKAREDGFLAVKFEASTPKIQASYEQANQSLITLITKELKRTARKNPASESKIIQILKTIESFSLSVGLPLGGSVKTEVKPASKNLSFAPASLPELLQEVTESLSEENSGFFIFIDEMQELNNELLEQLVLTQHQLGSENLPFFIIGAGLPTLTNKLTTTKSYSERLFSFRKIHSLDPEEAKNAFSKPAETQDAQYSEEALDELVASSGCYPFFIQEFGQAMWEVAKKSPFSATDAQEAVRLGTARLDSGFFETRWNAATNAGKEYMRAMAMDSDGKSTVTNLCERLQKKTSQLSPVRNQLLSRGLIYSPNHGVVKFTVPGMADFVRRQKE